jgi:hypothetical protein
MAITSLRELIGSISVPTVDSLTRPYRHICAPYVRPYWRLWALLPSLMTTDWPLSRLSVTSIERKL